MNKIFILLCLLWFSQCKQKPFESNTTDNSFTEGEIIDYQYDASGRLVQEHRESYFLMGNRPDSLKIYTTYLYDEKGRKVKSKELDESNQDLSTTLFLYNQRDSLLAEYTIDALGDTTRLVENSYNEDGKLHLVIHRQLLNKQSEDAILNGQRSFDTLFTWTENFYEVGLLIKSTDRDSKNTLISEREYEYNGQQLVKLKVYEFPGSQKQLTLTNTYFPKDLVSTFERVTVNMLGDTIGVKQVVKNEKGNVAKIIELDTETGFVFITNINEQGRIVAETEIIKAIGEKTIRNFTYDSLGRKTKVVSVDVPLSEEEKSLF